MHACDPVHFSACWQQACIGSMILGAQYELTNRRDLADVSTKIPPARCRHRDAHVLEPALTRPADWADSDVRIYARVHLIIPGRADRHYEVSTPSLRRRGERPFDIVAGELGTTKARLRRTARVSSVRLLFRLSAGGPPLALVRDYVVCRPDSARHTDRRLARRASYMHMLLPMRDHDAYAGFRIVSFLEESKSRRARARAASRRRRAVGRGGPQPQGAHRRRGSYGGPVVLSRLARHGLQATPALGGAGAGGSWARHRAMMAAFEA